MLVALDVDHNGEISTGEMNNAPAILLKLARNGDGQLTEDELRPRPAAQAVDSF